MVQTTRRTGTGALVLGALLVATGCAGARRIPLASESSAKLQTVRPIAALNQQEIKTSIVVSNSGAAFGLIGALVDTAVNNSAAKTVETKVVPVRNALVGWDAGVALRAALEREVRPVTALKAGPIEVKQLPDTKDAIAALVAQTKADALFLVQADYRLTPSFDAVVVTAKVSLLPCKAAAAPAPTEDASAEAPKPLYLNTFVTSAGLSGFAAATTPEQAAAMWAADGGRPVRVALDGSIDELARMIAFDVVQSGPAGASSPSEKYEPPADAPKLTSIGPYATGVLNGYPVRQEKGRAWLRVATGELAAVPGQSR
jgi:hypothetical protein